MQLKSIIKQTADTAYKALDKRFNFSSADGSTSALMAAAACFDPTTYMDAKDELGGIPDGQYQVSRLSYFM